MAAQLLSGKGFDTVLNVSGGIKAYQGNIAIGPEDQGVYLFTGKESIEDTLVTAYSLEQGLREFYLSMEKQADNDQVKEVFSTLADIEIIHQDNLLEQYRTMTGVDTTREDMEKKVKTTLLEGGMTTEEYMALFNTDLGSSTEVVSMAMSIEAQALDLYERSARRAKDEQTVSMLNKIANEEKHHLEHLGKLMDSL